MARPPRTHTRLIGPRWLLATSLVAGACILVPSLAVAAEPAVAEQTPPTQVATPANEATPVAGTETAPQTGVPGAAPAEGTTTGVETPAAPPADLAGLTAAAAPAAEAAPVPANEAVPAPESAPTPAPAPALAAATPQVATPLPVTPDPPKADVPPPPARLSPAVVTAPPVVVPPPAPDRPSAVVAARPDSPAPVVAPSKVAKKKAPPAAPGVTLADFTNSLRMTASAERTLVATPSSEVASNVAPQTAEQPAQPEYLLTTPTLIEATSAAPLNVAPSGSSLLAVLASYALPGGSGPPASTLVLFIVIGLILLVAAAPRPGLSERVVASGLLGASSGHRLAVRRPG